MVFILDIWASIRTYRDFELDKLVTNLQLDTGARVSYPVLNVKVFLENGEVKIFRALNEASIRRSDRTMVAECCD